MQSLSPLLHLGIHVHVIILCRSIVYTAHLSCYTREARTKSQQVCLTIDNRRDHEPLHFSLRVHVCVNPQANFFLPDHTSISAAANNLQIICSS